MKSGYLSEFFTGVAIKALTAVEADPARSHQHEFNGNQELIRVFGRATEKHSYPARFIY
ncbi:MAG: restriction endonuclease, partial [Acidobacteriia bacterium]|nr:restriction endonuclease [Terriglobia bacterium]